MENQLAERFQAISTHALDVDNLRFLELAENRLAPRGPRRRRPGPAQAGGRAPVAPLRETLAKVEASCGTASRAPRRPRRAGQADGVRTAELRRLRPRRTRWSGRCSGRRPGDGGASCSCAGWRRSPAWPALRLRRAGERRHRATAWSRPDMVVRLAGGKNVIVDSKVSLAAYLEAAEADDPSRGGPAGRPRPARARARGPAGRQVLLAGLQPGAGVRGAVHPRRGVPRPGVGARPGAAGVRDAQARPHRHSRPRWSPCSAPRSTPGSRPR